MAAWNHVGTVKLDWAVSVWFCCFVVFVFSMLGLKRCSALIFKLLKVVGWLLLILVVLSTIHCLSMPRKSSSQYKGLQQYLDPVVSFDL